MYFCGLKGMMPGIQDMLKEVCRKKGKTYDDFVADLKKKGQWRVEVYYCLLYTSPSPRD